MKGLGAFGRAAFWGGALLTLVAAAGVVRSRYDPGWIRAEAASREGMDAVLRMDWDQALERFDLALAERPSAWDRYGRARARFHTGDLAGARSDLELLGVVPEFRTPAMQWLARLTPPAAPTIPLPPRRVSLITEDSAGAVARLASGDILFAPPTGQEIFRAGMGEPPRPFAGGFGGVFAILPLHSGEIAVCDMAEGRVVLLSHDGNRLGAFPEDGLLGPAGVAETPEGDLLVSVSGTGEVVRFRRSGTGVSYERVTSYLPDPPFLRPRGLLALPDGGFLVAEAGRSRIVRCDAEGTIRASYAHPLLRAPTSFAGIGEGYFVSDASDSGGLFRAERIGDSLSPVAGSDTAVTGLARDPNGTLFLASRAGLWGYRFDDERRAWVDILGVRTDREHFPVVEILASIRDPSGEEIDGLTGRNLRVLTSRDEVVWPIEIQPPDPARGRRLVLVWADPDLADLDRPLGRLTAAWGNRPSQEEKIGTDLVRLEKVVTDLARKTDERAILLLAGDVECDPALARKIGDAAAVNGVPIFVLHTGQGGREALSEIARRSRGSLASPYEANATLPLERALASYHGGLYRIRFEIRNPHEQMPRELVPILLEANVRGLSGFDRFYYRVPVP